VVTASLLAGAARLSAQAPRAGDQPGKDAPGQAPQFPQAGAGFPDPADLQRLMQMMMQMQQQQMQQLMNMPLPPLPGARRGLSPAWAAEARLGVQLEAPAEALIEQLDLPVGQGQVVTRVIPGDPAARAGVLPNDILLELDGKAVPSDPAALARAVEGIKSKVPVDALVLRKGAKKKLAGLALSDAPAAPPAAGGGGALPPLPPLPGGGFGPRGLGVPHGPLGAGLGAANVPATFTISSQQGDLTIEIEGTVDNGTVTVNDITVTDGGKPRYFSSVDKVPEEYRERVQTLIDRAGKGRAGANAANP
jgi:hypothetical protein